MSFRDEVIEFEKAMIGWLTDPESSWDMLVLFPGIGLPLSLSRGAYTWYTTGETLSESELQSAVVTLTVREVAYYAVWESSLNISSSSYMSWKTRGGMAVGQMGSFAAKQVWKSRSTIGAAALAYAAYSAWDWLIHGVAESLGSIAQHAVRHASD